MKKSDAQLIHDFARKVGSLLRHGENKSLCEEAKHVANIARTCLFEAGIEERRRRLSRLPTVEDDYDYPHRLEEREPHEGVMGRMADYEENQ